MTRYRTKRLKTLSLLIIATILLLIDSLFYIMFYRAMKENGKDFIAAIQAHHLRVPLFCLFTLGWFIVSIIAFIKYTGIARYYGKNLGSFFGRLIIIGEWVTFALLIVFIFI